MSVIQIQLVFTVLSNITLILCSIPYLVLILVLCITISYSLDLLIGYNVFRSEEPEFSIILQMRNDTKNICPLDDGRSFVRLQYGLIKALYI